ncbi:hypothetical protein JB92DRAFT_2859159 [Gautieria morchelliformis]|nr:hypothetical protein JB92DRAFT_2859159 [Gautieria morchelliformis]
MHMRQRGRRHLGMHHLRTHYLPMHGAHWPRPRPPPGCTSHHLPVHCTPHTPCHAHMTMMPPSPLHACFGTLQDFGVIANTSVYQNMSFT